MAVARVYANPDDLTAYTGQPAPADATRLLTRASQMLDSQVLRACWYVADPTTGMPTDSLVLAAFRDAACAQVEWWQELGDSTGAAGVGWGGVKIGSVDLSRSVTSVSGSDSPARQIAPQVWDALQAPDLTPDRFRLGAVTQA
ncbi:hypothetical protein RMN57_13240 [Kitasatospora sp. CM 4170]|uniref:Uncharacterized protein n=1 Tax=Kitasatospora aburaviensis TaxID=67265 RepID=A0ABW1EU90_9ACTN|nr:hypothetical protein [Kitasatospora sp. CM 4170]WNM45619.1 hypothetical protein RMN57_13240 [Kitasatospora sp. CM 4170]